MGTGELCLLLLCLTFCFAIIKQLPSAAKASSTKVIERVIERDKQELRTDYPDEEQATL